MLHSLAGLKTQNSTTKYGAVKIGVLSWLLQMGSKRINNKFRIRFRGPPAEYSCSSNDTFEMRICIT